MLGVIGGSGLYSLAGLGQPGSEPRVAVAQVLAETPFGQVSSPLEIKRLEKSGRGEIAFIARHGADHSIPPHQVPYRANIWALRAAGVEEILAVNSVGSLRTEWEPGSLVIPDQLIDYTWGRELSFAGAGDPVQHLDFSNPYTPALRGRVLAAAASLDQPIIDGATYGCTQGPRFETPAEIRRMAGDGCDLVGMTAMPEAILARELGLAYCAICIVGNLAAGLAGPDQVLSHDDIAATTALSLAAALRIIAKLA